MNGFIQKWKGKGKNALLTALLLCTAALLLFPFGEGAGSGTMTGEEKRISAALSRIAGAGETRVAIYYTARDETILTGEKAAPCGAIIVSVGAKDVAVRLDLMRAAQTLLGLPAGAVEVFPAEEGK